MTAQTLRPPPATRTETRSTSRRPDPVRPPAPSPLLGRRNLVMSDLDIFKVTAPSTGYPPYMRTFYSPEDFVPQVLQTLISSVTQSVIVAMFGYDDETLAAMLDAALRNPAIYVQITLDRSQANGPHEKALLARYANDISGNSVAIGTSERGAIMHRKMVIVDGVWRISGSTNWSSAGETLQDNELTVIRDPMVCAEARPILDVEHDKALKQMAAARTQAHT